jgi:hypothetical protein
VPLSRNRSRPRCTVRGAAHSHAAHGLGRHSVRGAGGPTRPARATRGARRERAASLPRDAALRAGGGSAPVHGRWRGNGGSPVRRRRRGATATGERRETASAASDRGGQDGGTSEASGQGVSGTREAVERRARRAAADRWGPLSTISE